jgi:guanylate kinase
VGKGTVAAEVALRLPCVLLSRSWTTRLPRPGERPDAYTFVSRVEFEQAIARGAFLEWEEFNGQLYGTPRVEVPAGRVLMLEIDVKGAATIKRLEPASLVITLEPPSFDALAERMRARGDDEAQIRRRLALADWEMREGRRLADAIVVNAELEEAVTRVVELIRSWASAQGLAMEEGEAWSAHDPC